MLACCLLIPAGPAEAGFSASGSLLIEDTRYVLTAPLRWEKRNWLRFSAGTLGVGMVALLDRPVRDGMQRNRNDTTDQIARIFEPFGAQYSFGILGGFYLAGAALDDSDAKAVARDGIAASLIAGGIITPVLKVAAGRSRPAENQGTYKFDPFSGHHSFPSGHTTQAFAVASVVAAHHEPLWVTITAYGIAGLVGFARIDHNAHFASDVAAGASIGTLVGRAVVGFNRRGPIERPRPRISFVLLPVGVGVTCPFDL